MMGVGGGGVAVGGDRVFSEGLHQRHSHGLRTGPTGLGLGLGLVDEGRRKKSN
jgi:hypothetical protein